MVWLSAWKGMLYHGSIKRIKERFMSRETEKALKNLQAFLDEKSDGKDLSEKELNQLLQDFMMEQNGKVQTSSMFQNHPETSDDYLDLAYEADTEEEALRNVKKALTLDPGNLDARSMYLNMTCDTDVELLEQMEIWIAKAEDDLRKEGYFQDDIGHFWGILETRPYMRFRDEYERLLIHCGMLGKAMEECEELLRLCEDDNLGVRHVLMHLYAYFEKIDKCEELLKEYPEHSSSMLLPLSIAYFKCMQFPKAKKTLKELAKFNKDLKGFLRNTVNGKLPEPPENEGYFRPGTKEEIFINIAENPFLYKEAGTYIDWADRVLSESSSKKKTKKKAAKKMN